jgi:hypothetical protein
MKKIALLVLFAFILSVGAPLSVQAVSEGDFCNPKKLGECQSKIDNLIASLDAFKAKLVNTKAELQGGKKITNQEADRMMKKIDEINKMLPSTGGNVWDY